MNYIARLLTYQARHGSDEGAVERRPLVPAAVPCPSEALRLCKGSYPEPWATRNSMIAGLGLPPLWKAELRRLSGKGPPRDVLEERWGALIDDVDYIASMWGKLAYESGWSLLHLFGCSPGLARRLDRDGLAVLLNGRRVIDLQGDHAVIANENGASHRFRRKSVSGAVLLWDA